jgi:sulfite exporter TauE/SafE
VTALLGTVLVASLVGSLHCAGMCGPVVAFYAGADPSRGARRLLGHLAYNGGRLATYVLLGAVFGAAGAAIDLAGAAAGLQRPAAITAGLLMVGWGLYALLQALGVRLPLARAPKGVYRATSRAYRALRDRPPVVKALLLGLISTFLPCGWLYAFAVLAAGTGSPWRGMAVMAVFWVGTIPVMLGLGVSLHYLAAPLRKRLPAITAVILIVMGLTWVVWRSGAPLPHAQPPDGIAEATEDARHLQQGHVGH